MLSCKEKKKKKNHQKKKKKNHFFRLCAFDGRANARIDANKIVAII
jgi:hypothetical protein